MSEARISAYLPPHIDPTKAPIAFGERALPKLNEELKSPDLITRQRSLMALCDLVHDSEYVYQAVHLGFMDSLKTLLYDEDSTVRQKTTEVFLIMAGHNIGREGILKSDLIIPLSHLLNDPVDIVRRNMHQTFEMLSELRAGHCSRHTSCLQKPNPTQDLPTVLGLVHTTGFLAESIKKLGGRAFLPRKPVVCTFFIEETVEELDEQKREQVLFFLDGSLNWLVVFLVGLVLDEKLERVYAKKPALAQNKV